MMAALETQTVTECQSFEETCCRNVGKLKPTFISFLPSLNAVSVIRCSWTPAFLLHLHYLQSTEFDVTHKTFESTFFLLPVGPNIRPKIRDLYNNGKLCSRRSALANDSSGHGVTAYFPNNVRLLLSHFPFVSKCQSFSE